MPNVRMPDGLIVQNVPEGTSPDELLQMHESFLKNLPEVGLPNRPFRDVAKLALGFFTTPDVNARIDMIRKAAPEAKITPFGGDNALVEIDGRRMILNKPGVSTQDIADIASSVVKFLPAGRAAQAVSGAGRTAAVLTGAAASGATSVAEDVAAGFQGSEQGIIPEKVALDTALGGGAELASPVIARGLSFVRNLFANPDLVVNGQLTGAGAKALRDAGLDSGQFRQMLRQVIERHGADAVNAKPDDLAALIRQTEAGDFGVDLTKGQATRDFPQLSREDTLRTSDVTTRAGRSMRDFDDQQVEQLAQGSRQVQQSIAGRQTAESIDEAGESVLTALRSEHSAARRAVDEAYDRARELPGEFKAESMADMVSAIRSSVSDEIVAKRLHPAANEALKNFRNLEKMVSNPNIRAKDFPLKRLEIMRRQLGNLIDSSGNPDDRRLVTKMKRAFDQWTDEAIDTAAFSGDDEALAALKKAREARADLGRKFERGSKYDSAGGIVDNLLNKDVTGREAANYIFGVSALGRKQGVTATVKRLREILPPEEFNTVREGAWLRVMEKAYQGGRFSRQKAITALNDALNGNGRAAMEELFSPEELTQMRKFRRVVASTVTPKDATGPSGTPRKLAQMAQQLAQSLGFAAAAATQNPLVAIASLALPGARSTLNFRAARDASKGFRLPAQRAAAVTASGIATGREVTPREETTAQ